MLRMKTSKPSFYFRNVSFGFFSLAVLALSICVLSGCKNPSESRYQLYSVNGSNITNSMGNNCTLCDFIKIPDRYMFGLSGTCGSMNGTIRCQGAFPNTFNIAAATIADITASNGSNLSKTYAKQSEQYASTNFINHTLVRRLSEAICSVLIASVVLSFFFLLLGFFVDTSETQIPKCSDSIHLRIPRLWRAMNEIVGAHAVSLGVNGTNLPVKFELGFWLLVGAAASRVLSILFVFSPSQSTETFRKSKSLRDTDNVNHVFYANLTSKIASTIRRLREAVETYQDQGIIDEGCKRLFMRMSDKELASLMPSHFYEQSAALFLGMHSEERETPPVPLLYQSCPCHGFTKARESSSRGVYLVVVRECCHRGGSPIITTEYKYVGSGRSARGVMLRVEEHTNPKYRKLQRSELYKAWDRLISDPCVAIYKLAEWDPLPIGRTPVSAKGFDEILLAEAIWQAVLQTSAQGNMSEFTKHLRNRGSGNADLISNVWRGCNVNSALEKIKTRE